MQRNNGGGGDPFFNFGDPFRGFGGFGRFGSSFFSPGGSPFADMNSPAFIEDQPPEPMKSRGFIIEELNSDEEKEESDKEKNKNPRKHRRLISGAYVEDPDDAAEEKRNECLQYRK
ncbi:hypothetical protein SLE2022_089040 [Rubroshorea leprosula]